MERTDRRLERPHGHPGAALFGAEMSRARHAYLVLVAHGRVARALRAARARARGGSRMRALRDSEVASQSIGLDPVLIRTAAFAISARAARARRRRCSRSISSFISPESFPFFQSILFVLVVMIGGAERVLGPVVGAVIVVLLPELLSSLAQVSPAVRRAAAAARAAARAGRLRRPRRRASSTRRAGRSPRRRRRDVAASSPARRARRPFGRASVGQFRRRACGARTVGFDARPGEITSIIGPNGAGKSTVLNLIGGSTGRSRHRAAGRADSRACRRSRSRVPASRAPIRPRSSSARWRDRQRAGRAAAAAGSAGARCSRPSATPRTGARRKPARVCRLSRPARRARRRAAACRQAPGRDRARARACARACCCSTSPPPGLIDADTERLGHAAGRIAALGIMVILVEHDMTLVMGVSDHVVVLDAGAKIAEGAPADVAADPAVLKAYLGDGQARSRARERRAPAEAQTCSSRAAFSAGYGAVNVLRDIDLAVAQGEMVAVLGRQRRRQVDPDARPERAAAGRSAARSASSASDIDALRRATRSRRAGWCWCRRGARCFPSSACVDNLRLGAYARPATDRAQRVERMLERFPQLAERAATSAPAFSPAASSRCSRSRAA